MRNRAITLAVIAAVVTAVACNTTEPVPTTVTFKATMNGASEVPANTSSGSGTFTGVLDTVTNVFTYDFTFTGLGSNTTAGHIHGPADPGVNADARLNFATLTGATFTLGQTSGSGHGVVTLNAATAITPTVSGDSLKKLLFAGKTYVNIHTVNIGSGEIRGHLIKQ